MRGGQHLLKVQGFVIAMGYGREAMGGRVKIEK
jgi:hypothetical protein